MGACDRRPCPVARVGDRVLVRFGPERARDYGVEVIDGLVVSVSPYVHALSLNGFAPNGKAIHVGGHGSPDEVQIVPHLWKRPQPAKEEPSHARRRK